MYGSDYEKIIKDANRLLVDWSSKQNDLQNPMVKRPAQISKLQRRMDEVAEIDFFTASHQGTAQILIKDLAACLSGRSSAMTAVKDGLENLKGKIWVTRKNIFVDRIACAWLITRFIDSSAEFLFVPKSKVMEIAKKEDAIAFDTPGAELHHRKDLCTFNVIIKDYQLTDQALLRMARIINAADTDNLDADPLAAGFEAIAVGYSLRYPENHANISGQFEVYDALYAWCRLDVAKNEA